MIPEFQVVVMAAGKGSRMPELTVGKPKCLLLIGNKPLVYYPLMKLQKSGFKEAFLLIPEEHSSEIRYALENTDLKIDIIYRQVKSSDEMGTADSLREIAHQINSNLIIYSCDLITNVDLSEPIQLFRKHDATLVSVYFKPEKQIENKVVPGVRSKQKPEKDLIGLEPETGRLIFLASGSDFEDEVPITSKLFRKHPLFTVHSDLIDGHIYIMKNNLVRYLASQKNISTVKGEFLPTVVRKQLIKRHDENRDDIFKYVKDDAMYKLIREHNAYNDHFGDMDEAYHGDVIRCYGYTPGNVDTYGLRINNLASYWSTNKKIHELWENLFGTKLRSIDPDAENKSNQVENTIMLKCTIQEKTSFRNSIIGFDTTVQSFSRVFDSIVMDHVKIHDKVALENCIICHGAVIESGCTLKNCVVGSCHHVEAGSEHHNEVLTNSDRLMTF